MIARRPWAPFLWLLLGFCAAGIFMGLYLLARQKSGEYFGMGKWSDPEKNQIFMQRE